MTLAIQTGSVSSVAFCLIVIVVVRKEEEENKSAVVELGCCKMKEGLEEKRPNKSSN